jgi:predicted nucleic acid-binding protein
VEYKRKAKNVTNPYIVENSINKIDNIINKYNLLALRTELCKDLINLLLKRYGDINNVYTKNHRPLRFSLYNIQKYDAEIHIQKPIPKGFQWETVEIDVNYEEATQPNICVDPSDKIHLDTAYYGDCEAFITADSRIIRNPEIIDYMPIIDITNPEFHPKKTFKSRRQLYKTSKKMWEDRIKMISYKISRVHTPKTLIRGKKYLTDIEEEELLKNPHVIEEKIDGKNIYFRHIQNPDYVVFGEYMIDTHTIYYEGLPDSVLVFDIYDENKGRYLPLEKRVKYVLEAGKLPYLLLTKKKNLL